MAGKFCQSCCFLTLPVQASERFNDSGARSCLSEFMDNVVCRTPPPIYMFIRPSVMLELPPVFESIKGRL